MVGRSPARKLCQPRKHLVSVQLAHAGQENLISNDKEDHVMRCQQAVFGIFPLYTSFKIS